MLTSIIVAMAKNRIIGRDGQLPWQLPEDLQRFRRLTMGQTLVMGRRTFESIGQPLPGRRTIVVSRNSSYRTTGCEVVSSLKAALQLAASAEEVFICGGAEIYRQALPLVDRIYLTEIDSAVTGDTCFPEFSAHAFREIYSEVCPGKISSRFSILQRHHCDAPLNSKMLREYDAPR